MTIRDYQNSISNEAIEILNRKKIVLIAMEVRTGKTITALETCKKIKAKKVLFITKKKAITDITKDYFYYKNDFEIKIINRENIHLLIENDFDIVIVDEVHGYSSFPKPSKYFKLVKNRFGKLPLILLSGTPTPESYSQFYHIFQLSDFSPFREYKTFYKWAEKFVNIKKVNLGYAVVNDYSDANKKKFYGMIKPYIITYTQKESGFQSNINEMILEVEMKPITYKIINNLKKNLVVTSSITGKSIVADTAVKLQQKIHQLSSGTIKFEDGTTQIIDNSKAVYILEHFKDFKIAIFYNFIAELEMLKNTIGTKLTTDLDDFNSSKKWIALQIVSGREGISLAKADALVMFNIQFSAVSYFQSRDRLTTKDRKENNVFWIFSKNGIENLIYKRVLEKKDYTNSIFKKDYGIENSKKNNYETGEARLFLRKNNKKQ